MSLGVRAIVQVSNHLDLIISLILFVIVTVVIMWIRSFISLVKVDALPSNNNILTRRAHHVSLRWFTLLELGPASTTHPFPSRRVLKLGNYSSADATEGETPQFRWSQCENLHCPRAQVKKISKKAA